MESKSPFDAVRSMMEDNLTKVGSATKNYLDLLQKSMLGVPNANEDQINAFRAYMERLMAAPRVRKQAVMRQRYSRGANSGRVFPVSNEDLRQRCDAYGENGGSAKRAEG